MPRTVSAPRPPGLDLKTDELLYLMVSWFTLGNFLAYPGLGHADGRSRVAGKHGRFGSTKSASNGKRRHPFRPSRTNMQAKGSFILDMDLFQCYCAMLGKDTGSDTTCSDAEGSGPKTTRYE